MRTASFAPAGFLISSISRRRSPTAIRSKRPNAALKRSSPATISSSDAPSAPRERGGGERVVDVVEARHAQARRRARPRACRAGTRRTRARRARSRARRRRAAAARARSSGSGSRRDGRRTPPRTRTASPQRTQYFESAACWSDGPRAARVVDAEDDRAGAVARELADLRVVAVHDERRVARGAPATACAPARRRRARARRSGRAGRGRGCRGRRPAAARARRPRAAPPRPPRTARARRRARRAASRRRRRRGSRRSGCARAARDRRRISAAIAAVVVLPFVAEMSAEPSGSRAASRSIAPGSSFQSSLPGTVVPPPVPASRESRPAARASAISARAEGARAQLEGGYPSAGRSLGRGNCRVP